MDWRLRIACLAASFLAISAHANIGFRPVGARSAGLGHASLTLQDGWSILNNPGSLGWSDQITVAAAYENRYFLPEIGLKAIAVQAPLGGGTIGLSGASYGFSSFTDNRVGLAYGRKLNQFISLGVQMNYLLINLGDIYGSRSTIAGELGILVKPTESLSLAAHVFNPTRQKLADFDDERVTTHFGIGARYDFSEKVTLVADVEKDLTLPINVQMGIEYSPIKSLQLRTGLSSRDASFSVGIGYEWKGLRLDVANHWDQQLGYGASVAFGVGFSKKE